MTHEISDDDIDSSVFLPNGSSILTPERLAKGDIKDVAYHDGDTHVRYAQACVLNVMSFLYEQTVLDDQQIYDGRTYEVWRAKARAFFTKELASYSATDGRPQGPGYGEYGFVLLVRSMHARDLSALNEAIDAPAGMMQRALLTIKPEDSYQARYAADARRGHYRRAFSKLVAAMPAVRDKIQEKKESAGRYGEDDLWASLRETMISDMLKGGLR